MELFNKNHPVAIGNLFYLKMRLDLFGSFCVMHCCTVLLAHLCYELFYNTVVKLFYNNVSPWMQALALQIIMN